MGEKPWVSAVTSGLTEQEKLLEEQEEQGIITTEAGIDPSAQRETDLKNPNKLLHILTKALKLGSKL